MPNYDICIAGAGIIGLSLALELNRRGASVVVLDRDAALSHASIAAAGMLAANDPENPAELKPLSDLSVALYPKFLSQIESLSGVAVPFQTSRTLQSHPSYPRLLNSDVFPELTAGAHHFAMLEENSIDPRQLATALLAAVRNTSIKLLEHTALLTTTTTGHDLSLETSNGPLDVQRLVHTTGAWSIAPVTPRKGQMLSVLLPESLPLKDVIRTPEIYIVPRIHGPRAGHALIGATVEEAGFDTATHPTDLRHLRSLAAQLIPFLGDELLCPTVDHWAGLRPATPDALPLLGPHPSAPDHFIATGHYRNGILLAPATAHLMAQLLCDEHTTLDLSSFSPTRFPVIA
jgi:glycine oxidase